MAPQGDWWFDGEMDVPDQVAANYIKRPIILDAMNLMHRATRPGRESRGMTLDCATILPVMRYFIKRGHTVHVVIPAFCMLPQKSDKFLHNHLLRELEKHVPGSVMRVTDYLHDDLLALAVARDTAGTVISDDRFRDHMAVFSCLKEICRRNISLNYTRIENKFETFDGDRFYLGRFNMDGVRKDQLYCNQLDRAYELVKEDQMNADEVELYLHKVDLLMAMAEADISNMDGHALPAGHMLDTCSRVPSTIDECDRVVIEKAIPTPTIVPAPLEGAFMTMEEAKKQIERRTRGKRFGKRAYWAR